MALWSAPGCGNSVERDIPIVTANRLADLLSAQSALALISDEFVGGQGRIQDLSGAFDTDNR